MQDLYALQKFNRDKGIDAVQPINTDISQENLERDEQIVQRLQSRLRERKDKFREALRRGLAVTSEEMPNNPVDTDHYEPQRLTRKICWQYDKAAKKVPLFRRHYI